MRLTTTVMLAVLCRAALAGETLGPESLLPVHDGRDAYAPAAACGKDVYLVVWQSGRMGAGDMTKGLNPIGDLVACRVDKSGKALDAKPFVICGAKDLQEQPQIAFGPSASSTGSGQAGSGQGGGVFLVVWQDLRNEKDWDVYAARVTPDGKVLDPDGILVAGGAHNQALPRVAWDGKAFQVVWQDFRSNYLYEVYGGRISAEGKALDGQGVLLASGSKNHYHCHNAATASAGGGKSFVLWVVKDDGAGGNPDAGGIFAVDGKPAGDKTISYKTNPWREMGVVEKGRHGPSWNASPLALAAGEAGYLAAWRTDYTAGRGGSPNESTAAIFDAEGKRVKSLFLAGKQHRIDAPEVCWDGSAYAAAWQENGGSRPPFDVVYAARITAKGEPGGEVHQIAGTLASPAREAAVASDGAGSTLIAYEKHPEKADTPIKIGFRILTAK